MKNLKAVVSRLPFALAVFLFMLRESLSEVRKIRLIVDRNSKIKLLALMEQMDASYHLREWKSDVPMNSPLSIYPRPIPIIGN